APRLANAWCRNAAQRRRRTRQERRSHEVILGCPPISRAVDRSRRTDHRHQTGVSVLPAVCGRWSVVCGRANALAGIFLLAVCCLGISGCSPTYVLRAGYEEAKILWRRQPIEQVLQRGDLDARTRAKLEMVLAVRLFARDTLHLRVGDSYATYAEVDP